MLSAIRVLVDASVRLINCSNWIKCVTTHQWKRKHAFVRHEIDAINRLACQRRPFKETSIPTANHPAVTYISSTFYLNVIWNDVENIHIFRLLVNHTQCRVVRWKHKPMRKFELITTFVFCILCKFLLIFVPHIRANVRTQRQMSVIFAENLTEWSNSHEKKNQLNRVMHGFTLPE